MYNRIKIENYKNLQNLELNNLGRVNLITGKNNTGKSSLLEAVGLLYTGFSIEWLVNILRSRAETPRFRYNVVERQDLTIDEENSEVLMTIFTHRVVNNEIVLTATDDSKNNSIRAKLIFTVNELGEGTSIYKAIEIQPEQISKFHGVNIALKLIKQNSEEIVKLNTPGLHRNIKYFGQKIKNFGHFDSKIIENDVDSNIWDIISLTDNAQAIINTLQIIEPKIEKLAFIENKDNKRKAMVKLQNKEQILPLQSMGDGLNRILSIVLRMVNSANGIFLLDEFENGLHYTVQEKLWKVIFELAKKLNIQVFATTHSQDCIYTFAKVLNEQKEENMGKAFRLENKKEQIIPIEYTKEELIVATEQNIEIR